MPGLGRKVFTAGDVLTASDVQSYLQDQTVMNFAGTAARSSAIATPTDGMVTYNQTNDQLEAYNGSAWVGMSGLQLIKKQTIGSAVTSVTVTNAFNATFENYRIIITGGVASAFNWGKFILGASVASYYCANSVTTFLAATTPLAGANNGAAANNSWSFSTTTLDACIDIKNPFLAKATTFSFQNTYQAGATAAGASNGGGWHNSAVSYTDITFSPVGAETLTGGTIYIYGYGV